MFLWGIRTGGGKYRTKYESSTRMGHYEIGDNTQACGEKNRRKDLRIKKQQENDLRQKLGRVKTLMNRFKKKEFGASRVLQKVRTNYEYKEKCNSLKGKRGTKAYGEVQSKIGLTCFGNSKNAVLSEALRGA